MLGKMNLRRLYFVFYFRKILFFATVGVGIVYLSQQWFKQDACLPLPPPAAPGQIVPPYNRRYDASTNKNILKKTLNGLKKILFWNDSYGRKDFHFGYGQKAFEYHGCLETACYTTSDRNIFSKDEVDMIIWHLRSDDKSLPLSRSNKTIMVFWMMESAMYTFDSLEAYRGVFNWTNTYRTDSDFFLPYGVVNHLSSGHRLPVNATRNYAAGKSKMVAWFVTNCHTSSLRERLTANLLKLVSVDVYGTCGTLTCPKNETAMCDDMLVRDYKFYLAFENSLCFEYVTEKLYKVLQVDIVPIVYGLGYDTLGLPPKSYINVLDFKSVDELAKHLNYLNENDTAYSEYFRWKSDYEVTINAQRQVQNICDMCQKLHEVFPMKDNYIKSNVAQTNSTSQTNGTSKFGTPPQYQKVYTDMHQWFVEGQCTDPFKNKELMQFFNGNNRSNLETIFAKPTVANSGVFVSEI